MGSNWQYADFDLDIGLVQNRRRAIIWTNGGPVRWCIHMSSGFSVLTKKQQGLDPPFSLFLYLLNGSISMYELFDIITAPKYKC